MNKGCNHRLTFRKDERLHHRSLVEKIFREGESIFEFPLRLVWRRLDREALERNFRKAVPAGIGRLQMMVTVPKKKRRRAVDRVLMRRRIREAYRVNRLPLKEWVENSENSATLSLAFIYSHDENLPYSLIEKKMITLLSRIRKKIEKTESTE